MTKVLIALLSGAAVGAALAVLFAPDKGSETRRKVGDYTGGLVDKLTDLFGSAMAADENQSSGHRGSQRGERKTSYSQS